MPRGGPRPLPEVLAPFFSWELKLGKTPWGTPSLEAGTVFFFFFFCTSLSVHFSWTKGHTHSCLLLRRHKEILSHWLWHEVVARGHGLWDAFSLALCLVHSIYRAIVSNWWFN